VINVNSTYHAYLQAKSPLYRPGPHLGYQLIPPRAFLIYRSHPLGTHMPIRTSVRIQSSSFAQEFARGEDGPDDHGDDDRCVFEDAE
jgi:hypothetical protein